MSNKISRRSFLKCAAVATLAVAVSGSMTGCTLLQPGYTLNGTTVQKVDNVNIAFGGSAAISDGEYVVTFTIENLSDGELDLPASSFRAYIKNDEIKVTGIRPADKPEMTRSSVKIARGEKMTIAVIASPVRDNALTNLNFRFHKGMTSVAYLIVDGSNANATTPYANPLSDVNPFSDWK